MFKRKSYDRLLSWKKTSNGATAVLLEGARRVGKTTLAKEFAKNEYADSIYIDFSVAPKAVKDLFENEREDVDVFLRMLQLYYGKRLPERRSVVVFDEVQRFPIAREYIKHLVEDGRFDYIETGSLISIKKNVEGIVIPSEEERIPLHPLDFEEYLWAMELDIYADEIRDAYGSLRAFPDAVHRKVMRIFDEYMLVGGMPQSVAEFAKTKDFAKCNSKKRQIIDLYLEDIEKFGNADSARARAIFREIPGQLSAASKRFKFSSLDANARFEDFEMALDWLESAHLVNICRRCGDPAVGYRLTEDVSSLKCYMGDTGLLVTHAFDDGPASIDAHREIQFGRLSVNRGMIVENMVAQQLTASGHSLFYHSWDEPGIGEGARSRAREIDFLVTRGYSDAGGKLRVCPVEVKSTARYSTVSLDDFRKRWPKRTGDELVLHPKQLKVEGKRLYLPLYMVHCV